MKPPIGSPVAGEAAIKKPLRATSAKAASTYRAPGAIFQPKSPGTWLAIVLLIVLPIAALWPLCDHDFVSWDDNSTIRDNPWFNPVTLDSLHAWWTTPRMHLYVPVTYTVWGVIAVFAGEPATADHPAYLNPVAFHSANLVLHVLAGLVVFRLLRLLIGRPWPAAAGALLFAIHPVQVEAVGWASGLKDVLQGLLALLALWQYLLAVQKSEAKRPGRIGWRWHYAVAIVAFVLAMLSKPNALMTPAIAGILDVMFLGRSWRQAVRWLWPWFVLSAGCVVLGAMVQPPQGPLDVDVIRRPLVAIASIGFYIRKLLWPTNLAVDYGLRPFLAVQRAWLVADAMCVACAAALLWYVRKSARPLIIGALVFLTALLPVVGFVTFDFQSYSNVADHYLYLPMFGIAIMAAWVAGRWGGAVMATAAGVILALLGTMSYIQTQYWLDTQSLFLRVIEVNPDSGPAYHSLALVALDHANKSTDPAEKTKLAQYALQLSRQAIDLRPEGELGYISYGMALYDLGRKDQAAESYAQARRLNPDNEAALEDLAGVDAETGRFAEAENLQRLVVEKNPTVAQDRFDLGWILEKQKKIPEAISEYQTAVSLQPYSPRFHNGLAEALAMSGQLQAAVEQYDLALRLDPQSHVALVGRQRIMKALQK